MTTRSIAAAYRSVSKRFGATQALRDIDLEIEAGTIHALVGENGAGKSTALGILAGRIAPSSGSVEIFGRQVPQGRPREARAAGLAAIYQELTIVPELSAEANVFIGQTPASRGVIARRQVRQEYERLCERVGAAPVPPGVPAGSLSVAEQQMLEIMRALAFDARLILLDEPTASLGIVERRALLGLMREMRDAGTTMVLVSHNLDEVLEVCDRATVFRGGEHVATRPRDQWDKRELVRGMIGDAENEQLLAIHEQDGSVGRSSRRSVSRDATPALRAEGVGLPGAIEDVSFEIRRGEIVGIGGLVGSGRTSLLRCLAGLEPHARGRLWIDGTEVPWPRSVRRAHAYGIALLPEDRKTQGLALAMSAAVNVVASDLGAVSRMGIVTPARMQRAAALVAEPFGFDPARITAGAGQLSGGNQQKLMFARWAHRPPAVLLVDEPTRGIDIAAKAVVLAALQDMADDGRAIVVVSSELEELVAVSDRIEVLAAGRQVAELRNQDRAIHASDVLDAIFAVEPA